MRLWIESAHQSLTRTGAAVCGDAISTFQTEEQFFAVVVSGAWPPGVECEATSIADKVASMLRRGTGLDAVMGALLDTLPKGEHVPLSILHVLEGSQARLVECDAPPLFITRGGDLVLLPVVEEEACGRLIRQCEFSLQDGDHVAMASEGYVRVKGWSRQWGWRDIAVSIRRLTETRCDAEQLLAALIGQYHRLAQRGRAEGQVQSGPRLPAYEADVSVFAMFARPMRTVTVWSGPPANRKADKAMLEKLMDEPGVRIICGDTSAEIAARLLRAELVMGPRPDDGWREVPPISRLIVPTQGEAVDLVTEGVVTMSKARERMSEARRARDLPRQEDGATRLARLLLAADKIHFLVGLTVNPAQAADKAGTVPLRRIVVQDLMRDLAARGKIVSVEYF